MTGMAAQGPLPAGMLRIRLGSQERYVWPVHLPGWLGLGWRVAGAEATPTPRLGSPQPSRRHPSPRLQASCLSRTMQNLHQPAVGADAAARTRPCTWHPLTPATATPEPTGTTSEADAADSEPPASRLTWRGVQLTNPG